MNKKRISSFVNKIVESRVESLMEEERERMKKKISDFYNHQAQLKQQISKLEQRVAALKKEVKQLREDVEVPNGRDEEKELGEKQEAGGPITKGRGELKSPDLSTPPQMFREDAHEKGDSDQTDESTQASRSQKAEEPSLEQTAAGDSATSPNSDKQLVDDFNRFLYDDLPKRDFEKRYNPIRLGIENEEERLDKAQAPVLLQKDDRGQYLAVERDTYYLVLPGYNLILDESVRRQAGFDEVFQCGDHPHQHPYRVKRVDKAARFIRERQEQFELHTPGAVALVRYG